MTEFFEGGIGSGTFAPRRKVTHKSKRMTKAMANLRRAAESDDDVQEISPREMSSKRKRARPDVVKVESDSDEEMEEKQTEESSSSDDDNLQRMRAGSTLPSKSVRKAASKKTAKETRRKKIKG